MLFFGRQGGCKGGLHAQAADPLNTETDTPSDEGRVLAHEELALAEQEAVLTRAPVDMKGQPPATRDLKAIALSDEPLLTLKDPDEPSDSSPRVKFSAVVVVCILDSVEERQ